MNKRDRGGGDFNMCAETKLKPLKGTNESDGISKKTPLYITRLVMIVSLYRTLGITLHTVRADYDDCVATLLL